ncbi:hypothetical protein SALBM311S_09682 [Streptomyces alboniger]
MPDERGLLTLGWYQPLPPVTQRYSGPASPYWASKAFLGLLLPENHPVWTAPEEPAPVDTADVRLALPSPRWLPALHRRRPPDGTARQPWQRPLPAPAGDRRGEPALRPVPRIQRDRPRKPRSPAPVRTTHSRPVRPGRHAVPSRPYPPARASGGRAASWHRARGHRVDAAERGPRPVGGAGPPPRRPARHPGPRRRLGGRRRHRAAGRPGRPEAGVGPPRGRPDQRDHRPVRMATAPRARSRRPSAATPSATTRPRPGSNSSTAPACW